MRIAGIQKISTVDFPGRLAAVVFAAGCNYRCFYCHNRQLIQSEEPGIPEQEIRQFLEKRTGLLDGIVVSGGEPTLQPDLICFLSDLKELGYQVKLDTNGSRPGVVKKAIEEKLADYVAVDYKAPYERYPALCGSDAGGVEETIEAMARSGVEWELRTTLVPQITEEELIRMAEEAPRAPRYALQLYRVQSGDTAFLKGRLPYTPAQIKKLAERIRGMQPGVIVRC